MAYSGNKIDHMIHIPNLKVREDMTVKYRSTNGSAITHFSSMKTTEVKRLDEY